MIICLQRLANLFKIRILRVRFYKKILFTFSSAKSGKYQCFFNLPGSGDKTLIDLKHNQLVGLFYPEQIIEIFYFQVCICGIDLGERFIPHVSDNFLKFCQSMQMAEKPFFFTEESQPLVGEIRWIRKVCGGC